MTPDTAKPTHVLVPNPKMSVSKLADYMAASPQVRRTIVAGCKYRPLARLHQHIEARAIIAEYLATPNQTIEMLEESLERLAAKICDNDFDEKTKQHNCNYVARFIAIRKDVALPKVSYTRPGPLPPAKIQGTTITFRPDVLTTRLTRRNTVKSGALMLRYAKGEALKPAAGMYQSAFLYGRLREAPVDVAADAELGMCLTLDAYSGTLYEAPTNAVYEYKNMLAVCADVAERWPAIKPPPNAILA